MKTHEIVEQARQSFDKELQTARYPNIHADSAHLEALLQMIDIQPHKHYLDLGTGNGYIAFEFASRFPSLAVTGLDIAVHSIQVNQSIQRERGLDKLDFRVYDGLALPFMDASYWGVISRYAFHHFPDVVFSVQELQRILEPHGFVIISDPITSNEDTANFIDQFQQLKPDGHVHFYHSDELEMLFRQNGFQKETHFMSTVSYPRDLSEAYLQLLNNTPAPILEKYRVKISEQTIQITVEVLNVLFRKNA
jgi:ubiquinone/menaquinone biosynthesis C-methylase UbiE